MHKAPVNIYFLCIQNRCRSQIAEAFAKEYGGSNVNVHSAGLEASDVHPLTVEVMREVGIDIASNVSKRIDMKTFVASNVIVKLCEQLKERCPIVPFGIANVEWNIEDPLVPGKESIEAVRVARDEIKDKVIDLLRGLNVPIPD
ncbi:arsenate reductase ArsC [Paenibacillus alginolyticus]|uniref:Arsenate reductase ArsC n=2 Tax=Paenibacillus alginolyticus TaxID=59839 RepID=A0ABT4G7R3_9BACL|nr:arsenate reductase ArsC [Paenibacillus alginolyticus]MCY9692216.1 arsenate reductase ArsC [Paenibacillus alginolyticus]